MPICPKCKNEYREGFKVCAECKCELVDSIEEIFEENEISSKNHDEILNEYLNEYINDTEEDTEIPNDSLTNKESPKDGYKSGIYRNSAERAEDNKSSAWTLLSVGVIGIIALVLAMSGVLPLHFYGITKYMIYGVMLALFILFVVMGLVSLRNSKIFAKKAESESSLSDSIREWCMANLKADELDAVLFKTDEDNGEAAKDAVHLSDEEKYFKRNEEIKRLISDKFINLDEGFLEDFVDHIYEDIFED